MSFLALKSPLSVHCSPLFYALSRPGNCRNPRPFSISMSATSDGHKSGVAIVWFKHDLRVEDHPGLVAAAQYSAVVPIYVFDHRLLSRYSDEMLELLLYAVRDLKKSLTALGSDLMIKFGRAEAAPGACERGQIPTYDAYFTNNNSFGGLLEMRYECKHTKCRRKYNVSESQKR